MGGVWWPMPRPRPPDQQQALKQLQAGHRQWTAGTAPGWAAGRARPGCLQAVRALRGLRDPAPRGGPPLVLLPAPQLPTPRVYGFGHPRPGGPARPLPTTPGASLIPGLAWPNSCSSQIIVFLCYGARLNKWVLQTYHPEYMKSPLVYHPGHRARAWRFLTYMFMHVG